MAGKSRPVMGYPSQGAAVEALWNEGKTTLEIVALVNNSEANVCAALSARGITARQRRERDGTGTTKRESVRSNVMTQYSVSGAQLQALLPHAAKRGIGVRDLIERIIDILADDQALIDNVLDDDDEVARIEAMRNR